MITFSKHSVAAISLLAGLLISGSLQAGEMLRVDFAGQVPEAQRIYSSDAGPAWGSLRVAADETATLSIENGRDYELRAGGWYWTQVQQVPEDVDAVEVTPSLEDEAVKLQLQLYQRNRETRQHYSSTVTGRLGEWIQLLGPVKKPGKRVYGTEATGGQTPQLFVRVVRVGSPGT